MGFVYVGAKTNQKINAYGKVGETNLKYLSQRVQVIRNKEGNFFVIKYLEIPNSTRAVTRAIEGHTRLMLEREGYENVQNDHFVWNTTIETKTSEYNEFAEKAMFYAKQYCKMMGIEYIEKEGNPTARRTVKRKKVA